MPKKTVSDMVVAFLEAQGVQTAFGVISIHNMPLLDAIGRRGVIRFIPSRGEAGGLNMADAAARVSQCLGVAFTSTGTAAGNAAGALIEALTAGSPVLHITGQIETRYLDGNHAYIHEAPAQLDMLQAISKKAYRIDSPSRVHAVLSAAVEEALTPPKGPVSIEIPIDIQMAPADGVEEFAPVLPHRIPPCDDEVQAVVAALSVARRPMILLGGGARCARDTAARLADMGVGFVTSTNGRAGVPEDHAMSLGAFNLSSHLQKLYETVDLMLVVGSRLRSNETWNYQLELPENLIRVDCDSSSDGKNYANSTFICADSALFLEKLSQSMPEKLNIDESFALQIASVRARCAEDLKNDLGPYAEITRIIQDTMPADAVWVRDVTILNSMWGNRGLHIAAPNKAVHAVGGGIGQGLPMAIGAALSSNGSKTLLLSGDGGLSLCFGELMTAVEQDINATMILMNDKGYGVIRNIQDAQYGSRQRYSNIYTPAFSKIAKALGVMHGSAASCRQFKRLLKKSLNHDGFSIVEVDMSAIGPFGRAIAGPAEKD